MFESCSFQHHDLLLLARREFLESLCDLFEIGQRFPMFCQIGLLLCEPDLELGELYSSRFAEDCGTPCCARLSLGSSILCLLIQFRQLVVAFALLLKLCTDSLELVLLEEDIRLGLAWVGEGERETKKQRNEAAKKQRNKETKEE